MTLTAILIALVTSVFLAQNQFYYDVALRSELQENARSVAELIGAEIRAVADSGMVVADSNQLVFMTPVYMGMVCSMQAVDRDVHIALEGATIDGDEISGFGLRDTTTGVWAYYEQTWIAMYKESGVKPRDKCVTAGADTVGAYDDYYRLQPGTVTPSPAPVAGMAHMLYRELEYSFAASTLVTNGRALYRGTYGDTLVELATGMSNDAHFEYRLDGQSTFSSSVSAANLGEVMEVRVVITTSSQAEQRPGGEPPLEFGWTVDVPLRNSH